MTTVVGKRLANQMAHDLFCPSIRCGDRRFIFLQFNFKVESGEIWLYDFGTFRRKFMNKLDKFFSHYCSFPLLNYLRGAHK